MKFLLMPAVLITNVASAGMIVGKYNAFFCTSRDHLVSIGRLADTTDASYLELQVTGPNGTIPYKASKLMSNTYIVSAPDVNYTLDGSGGAEVYHFRRIVGDRCTIFVGIRQCQS